MMGPVGRGRPERLEGSGAVMVSEVMAGEVPAAMKAEELSGVLAA